MRKFFDWIINTFTYVQTYLFICLLFVISLLPIGYFWIKTQLSHVQSLDIQLMQIKEEKSLLDLYSRLQIHRRLTQLYYYDPNEEKLKQLRTLEEEISQLLENFKDSTKTQHSPKEFPLLEDIFPEELTKKWQEIINNFSSLSPRENESLQIVLLHDINILFDYLAERVGITSLNQIDGYDFIQGLFLRLPSFQESLSELILISERILAHPGTDLGRDRAQSLIDLLKADINYFEKVLDSHFYKKVDHLKGADYEQTANSLIVYIQAAAKLIEKVETKILQLTDPSISLNEFENEIQDIMPISMQAWRQGLDTMSQIFEMERSFIWSRLWWVFLSTLLLTTLAFLLGLALIYTGIMRLLELTQATHQFTNGDLSVRVPDVYQDEIGQQAKAFNRMAQRLEELINNLYKLIDATSTLAKGNLKVRIPLHQKDSEFEQVALSFNKMAETFENIIGRLQQIGLMLTTSASEISSASKNQETTIVEQEGTTRDIALAANEISSTVKKFANTMNEVNQAVEQTSNLALEGKDSLNHMESIMHNMVEASTKIGAKLAVLNEKASTITSVITTITKVADQTNLLSLNASIEAEKAGEYGRSFAVIAREIRRLADQTAIATLDIENRVNEIMTAVSSSVRGVEDFTQEIQKGAEQVRTVGGQLATIIQQVEAFTASFEMINQGMQAQSTGAEQINEAIAQLSHTARQTTEAIHQFHKTVQELNQVASELSILNPFGESATVSNLITNKLKSLSTQLHPEHPNSEN